MNLVNEGEIVIAIVKETSLKLGHMIKEVRHEYIC